MKTEGHQFIAPLLNHPGHGDAQRRLKRERLERALEWLVATSGRAGFLQPAMARTLAQVLQALLLGYDVRPALGVKPRRGAPPKFEGPLFFLAMEYFALKETMPEKAAASYVAEYWRMSAANVRRHASRWKDEYERRRESMERRESKDFDAMATEMRFFAAISTGKMAPALEEHVKQGGKIPPRDADMKLMTRFIGRHS